LFGIISLCMIGIIVFYGIYLIMKIAVKHAISENLEDISCIIKNAISESRIEYKDKNDK